MAKSDDSGGRHRDTDTPPRGTPTGGRTRVTPSTGKWTPGPQPGNEGKSRHAQGNTDED